MTGGTSTGGTSSGSGSASSPRLQISGSSTIAAGDCHPFTISAVDPATSTSLTLTPNGTPIDLNIRANAVGNPTYLPIYTDAACSVSSGSFSVPSPSSSLTRYFKSSIPGSISIFAEGHPSYLAANPFNFSVTSNSPYLSAITLAGPPHARGYAERSGSGGVARFNAPAGLVCDSGNVWVADPGNRAIRSVDASFNTAIVGGTLGQRGVRDSSSMGDRGSLDQPRGMVLLGSKIYFVETWAHVVRSLDLSTGQVTTIAGLSYSSGSADGVGQTARFSQPAAITSDGVDTLYVSDRGNSAVRKVRISTGFVETLTSGVPSPGALAILSGTLYVHAQVAGDPIYPVNLTTGSVGSVAHDANTLVGAMATRTSNSSILISIGSTVQEWIPGNSISTVAGSPTQQGQSDGTGGSSGSARFGGWLEGICISGTFAYVADSMNHTIRKIDLNTNQVTTAAGAADTQGFADLTGSEARFRKLEGGVRIGSDYYALDRGNSSVRKISAGGLVTTVISSAQIGGASDWGPTSLATNQSALFVIDANGNLKRFNLAGSLQGSVATCTHGHVAVGGTHVFVSCPNDHTLKVYTLSLTSTGTYGSPGVAGLVNGFTSSARFNTPRKITSDGMFFYVIDQNGPGSPNPIIRKIDPNTESVSTVGSLPEGYSLHNASLAADSNFLYIALPSDASILRFDIATRALIKIAGYFGQQSDSDGNLSVNGHLTDVNSVWIDPMNPSQGFVFTNGTNVRELRQ